MRLTSRLLPLALLLVIACESSQDDEQLGSPEFYNNNAQRYYDGKKFAQSREQFEKALELDSTNQTALLGRAWATLLNGEILVQQGKPEGAEQVQESIAFFEELQGFALAQNTFKVELGLGTAHSNLGDLYAARARKIQDTAERRPIGPKPTALREALEQRDQEYAKAAKYFNDVLAQTENPSARDNLSALLHLAQIAEIYQNHADALSYAERYLVQVRRSKDLWVDAIAEYPENREMWEEKLAGAVTQEVEVRSIMADVNFMLGRLDEAEDQLQQVILLSPERSKAYLKRGIVREDLGKKKEAVDDLRRFVFLAARLDMSPDDPDVLEAVKRLDKLEKELGLKPTVPPGTPRAKDA